MPDRSGLGGLRPGLWGMDAPCHDDNDDYDADGGGGPTTQRFYSHYRYSSVPLDGSRGATGMSHVRVTVRLSVSSVRRRRDQTNWTTGLGESVCILLSPLCWVIFFPGPN